jgi:hypothetical protein
MSMLGSTGKAASVAILIVTQIAVLSLWFSSAAVLPEMAREAGARKVFFASAAPPVRCPNVYGIDMPAREELIAAHRSEAEVQEFIGADWLVYQDLEDLVTAVHHENSDIVGFDTSCFSGEYVTGDVTREYLDELEAMRSNTAKAECDAEVRRDESDDDTTTIQAASGL